MKNLRRLATLLVVLCSPMGLIAQVGGSGTAGRIPVWTGTATLGNSNIAQSNGSACTSGVGFGPCIGVGISNPAAHLHVFKNLNGETTLLKVENGGSFSAASLELKASANDNLNDWLVTAQDTSGGSTEGFRILNRAVGQIGIEVAPNLNVGVGTFTPTTKLQVSGGDMDTSDAGAGLIVKSPNGAICARIGIDNGGAIVATPVTCP